MPNKFESKTLLEWIVSLDLAIIKLEGLNESNVRLASKNKSIPMNINCNGEDIGIIIYGADGYALTPEQFIDECLTDHKYIMRNVDINNYDLDYMTSQCL